MSRIIAFVLAEGQPHEKGHPSHAVFDPTPPQSAPQYFGDATPQQLILGHDGDVVIKSYPPTVLLAELSRSVTDPFSREAFALRDAMIEECRQALGRRHATLAMSEEYALAVVSEYEGPPEQFLRQGAQIAGFLKSESLPLDEQEIAYTLETQIKYGEQDMVILDWDGAFVFEPTGNVEATLELFELANLQLLRYRMLGDDLDRRLRHLEQLLRDKTGHRFTFWSSEISKSLREVIRIRTTSILEFDAIIRDVKLIGDWYSARLYDLAAKKFRLEDWRKTIKEKLALLEDIYGIVAQNFSINKQIFVEFALQIGWFTLLALEVYQILR